MLFLRYYRKLEGKKLTIFRVMLRGRVKLQVPAAMQWCSKNQYFSPFKILPRPQLSFHALSAYLRNHLSQKKKKTYKEFRVILPLKV